MADPAEIEELRRFVGEAVVLDTRGPLVYLGILERCDAGIVYLKDADVHDLAEGRTTKEVYILEAKKYGVRKNRNSVAVRLAEVVSLSRLADVVEY